MVDVLKTLLRITYTVLRHGRWPAVLLMILIVANGVLLPLNLYFWEKIIDTTVQVMESGGSVLPILPYLLGFIVLLALYNLRELCEQIVRIRLTHRLRDNFLPQISRKMMNLEYWCLEDREIHDLIMRVGSSPEEQFVQTYWELLFVLV